MGPNGSYNSAIDIINGAFELHEERPNLVPRLSTLWPTYTISTVCHFCYTKLFSSLFQIILYAIALLMPYWPNAVQAIKTGDRAVKEIFESSVVENLKAQQAMVCWPS